MHVKKKSSKLKHPLSFQCFEPLLTASQKQRRKQLVAVLEEALFNDILIFIAADLMV